VSGTDSAGTPWSGRTLSGTGFEADEGAADAALLDALAEAHARPSAEADARLVRAAAAARWLVPVVALLDEAADSHEGDRGHTVDKRTDMAVVTLTAPDGRRALPIFTSTAALAAWDAAARPVPLSAARAAQAAVAEGCQVAVVDLGGETPTELRPSMVWALAQEADWQPAHTDPFVARAVARSVAEEDDVVEYRLEEGDPAGRGVLRVVLALPAGVPAATVEALATRVGERLAVDGELRARVDELTFAVEAVRR
jgi:hypothetical protein